MNPLRAPGALNRLPHYEANSVRAILDGVEAITGVVRLPGFSGQPVFSGQIGPKIRIEKRPGAVGREWPPSGGRLAEGPSLAAKMPVKAGSSKLQDHPHP